jgi:hypothetical protein
MRHGVDDENHHPVRNLGLSVQEKAKLQKVMLASFAMAPDSL